MTPFLPLYRKGALCDLLPSAAACIGVPGFDNVLDLPQARQVCVFLVDGLGAQGLAERLDSAPFLATMSTQAGLTAGFPSTTSTSLTSLTTGVPPAVHGMLGYKMRIPGTKQLLHSLRWGGGINPVEWQPHPTVFEKLAEHGVPGYHVASRSFEGHGLSLAAWRGARSAPADTPGDVIAQTAIALRHQDTSIVVAYTPDLDRTGHQRGWQSASWEHQLAIVDHMASRLHAALPPGTLLIITGDHGMVDVPPHTRVNIDVADPAFDPTSMGHQGPVTEHDKWRAAQLSVGLELLSGEDRTRYLHVAPGAVDDVLATWRELLGSRAWIVSREQAIEENWYGGSIAVDYLDRIGDIIVAAGPDLAIGASVREPREFILPIGLHGSLTEAEQRIPLLLAQS